MLHFFYIMVIPLSNHGEKDVDRYITPFCCYVQRIFIMRVDPEIAVCFL